MADKYRHPNAGCGDFDRSINNFFGLGDHFPFFFGGAIFHEHIDMWDDIKSDLLGVD